MHLAANQLLQNDLCCLLHAFSWQQKTHSKEDPFPRKLWERNPINFSGTVLHATLLRRGALRYRPLDTIACL